MRNLVIYDTIGRIIFQASGNVQEPKGVPFMWVEIPEGKRLVSIDTTDPENHTPVFQEISKSEELTRLELLEDAVNTIILGGDMIL